jgi:uncharacterized oxidoreductase
MRLTNNKILITGATDGIGKALAERFVALNNLVIAVGRNQDKLEELTSSNKNFIGFQADVSNMEDLERLSIFISAQHPDLNILINNAGVQFNYHFEEELHLMNKIDYEVTVNFLAPIKLTGLLLPILKLNDNAAVVNVSSGLGLVPKMQAPVYCGTKAGIHIFTKSLRYQLKNVKVFEIIPPLVQTSMTEGRGRGKILPAELVQEFMKAFEKDVFEVNIGKVKLLKLINRISPAVAEKIMKGGR